MASIFYELLSSIGYNHPLHPAVTHLPVGLTIASFIFIFLAYFLKLPKYAQSAKHCAVLALLAAIPTAVVGYLDWQHFYGGSYLFPIKMKLGLAVLLVILLFFVVRTTPRPLNKTTLSQTLLHLFCVFVVIGLGYFGGELIYGKKVTDRQINANNVADTSYTVAGAKLFEKKCAFCHLTDSTDTKVGPGLKGLFKGVTMPVSGWPVSADSVQRQLKSPFKQMPSFESLNSKEVNSLTIYLKSL
jgi:uncharacterized membrane protein